MGSLTAVIFDRIFWHHRGLHNMHPALVFIVDIIQVPACPAAALGFRFRDGRRRLLHIEHAFLTRRRPALLHGDLETGRSLILNEVVRSGR